MIIENIPGMLRVLRKKPQFVGTALNIAENRLNFYLGGRNPNGRCPNPDIITIFITDRCMLRCSYCHYALTDRPGFHLNQVRDMRPEIYTKIVDETPAGSIVAFTGGEPLLHPQIAEFVRYAKDKQRLTTLTTNGWLLEKQAEEICQTGLDLLSISVDGPQAVHDAARGNGSYERLQRGLQAVLKITPRPVVFVTTVISDINYGTFSEMHDLAQGWGVDGLNINHLWMQTDESVESINNKEELLTADHVNWKINTSQIDPDCVFDQLQVLRQRSRASRLMFLETPVMNREQIQTWYQEPNTPVLHDDIRCGWLRFKVWSDGQVKPCRDMVVGDIANQSFNEIWHGEEYQQFREVLAREGMLPICVRCCLIVHR